MKLIFTNWSRHQPTETHECREVINLDSGYRVCTEQAGTEHLHGDTDECRSRPATPEESALIAKGYALLPESNAFAYPGKIVIRSNT